MDTKTVRTVPLCLGGILAAALCVGCAGTIPSKVTTNSAPPPPPSFSAALTSTAISAIRQEFPQFSPEMFTPGTNPMDRGALTPDNFYPARFFGPATNSSTQTTPGGLILSAQGFDQSIPATLPPTGTYIGPDGTQLPFALGPTTLSPVDMYLEDAGAAPVASAPTITIDSSQIQVTPEQVDSLMLTLRTQFATVEPKIANVNPAGLEIIIEPTIMNVQIGSNAPAWSDGYCSTIGGNRTNPKIYLTNFYITASGKVYNWQYSLIDQAMEYYFEAVGEGAIVMPSFTASLDLRSPGSWLSPRAPLLQLRRPETSQHFPRPS